MNSWALLHGFTGAPASWDEVRARAEGVATFAPACMGHAEAAGLDLPSFDAEVDRLASEIASRIETPRGLVGYSMGGRLALGLLVRYGQLFQRAIVVGGHPGLDDQGARAARRRDDARLVECLRREGLEAFVNVWEKQAIFDGQGGIARKRLAAQREIRLSQTANGLARSLEVCGLGAMPPLSEHLSSIEVPVTFVVGGRDAKFLSLAQAMARRIPSARTVEIPGVGHNVLLEAPEALARILREGEYDAGPDEASFRGEDR